MGGGGVVTWCSARNFAMLTSVRKKHISRTFAKYIHLEVLLLARTLSLKQAALISDIRIDMQNLPSSR